MNKKTEENGKAVVRVITYGTFDLFHEGHLNILKRARELGNYLIVGVTSDKFDRERGKLNVHNSLVERIEMVKKSGLADQVIIEEYEGQKIEDIIRYKVSIFAIGSDWIGKFDYLKDYCSVVYIERTKGISSTQLRDNDSGIKRLGIIGNIRTAHRIIAEAKFVSGIHVEGVFNPNLKSAEYLARKHQLAFYTNDFDQFCERVHAVYIAASNLSHGVYIHKSLVNNKHVLCEQPIALSKEKVLRAYQLAHSKELILLQAIQTAFTPAFLLLVSIVKSGTIGTIKDIEVTCTRQAAGEMMNLPGPTGGSMFQLGSSTLLPIIKIFGPDFKKVEFYTYKKDAIDLFTKGFISYENTISTFKVGLGVKSEGELIISGTKGYAYVPAPWWETEYFELRFGDTNHTKKYFYKIEGDGLRYELNEFLQLINHRETNPVSPKLSDAESVAIVSILEQFRQNINVHLI